MPSIGNKQKMAVAIVSGMILLTGGLTACNKSPSVEALVLEAQQYHDKGDNKAAVIQLKNALQKAPEDREARALLGTIYVETGDPQSAEKELRKALSLGISPARVTSDLAKALLMQGQFQQVLDATPQAPGEKGDAAILVLRGNAYMALGKGAEAKDSFELALKETPHLPSALVGLAKWALLEKNLDAATNYVEQATANNSADTESRLFKGDFLRAQGKSELALVAYEDVLKIKPDHTAALLEKATIEIGLKKFDAAKLDIDAAKKSAPNTLRVLYTQALLDFSQGNHAVALESLQQILRVAPEDMPSVLLAGAVQHALGSTQQAEQHLKKYLEKNPGHLYARKLLASALIKNGQAARALDVLAPALQTTQSDAQLFALAGEAYMKTRDYSKATEYFEKASKIAPRTATLHTSLGLSRLAQGENARAVADLEMAASLDPKSPKAGTALVMTHLRLKEYDKALAEVQVLEKEQPDNPLFQNMKGGVYLGKNDVKNARASFEKALALQPTYFPAVSNLAQLDVQDKKPEQAKKRFEAILEKDKKNAAALNALAGLALAQGKKEEATALLERASNENPDAIAPAMQLIAHYLRTGDKQKALTLARKLQVANPANADLLDLLAQAQLANDDKAGALETYGKVAVVLPDAAVVHYRIAAIQMAMRNAPAAADSLKKALAIQPDYPDAQLAQATMESGKGNFAQALALVRQVQKQHGNLPTGYVVEGDILMAQKTPLLAAKAYEKALGLGKAGATAIKLHASLQRAGKEKEANAHLAKWLKDHPADVAMRTYFADTHLAARQYKAAIEQYQIILRTEPANAAALNNLAWAYQQEKDPRALEMAEKALQVASNSPAIMDTLGWMLIEKGNTERGLPLLDKALALAPAASEIRYHLALGLIKSGDKGRARKELEQLLTTDKNFARLEEVKALLKQM